MTGGAPESPRQLYTVIPFCRGGTLPAGGGRPLSFRGCRVNGASVGTGRSVGTDASEGSPSERLLHSGYFSDKMGEWMRRENHLRPLISFSDENRGENRKGGALPEIPERIGAKIRTGPVDHTGIIMPTLRLFRSVPRFPSPTGGASWPDGGKT